MTKPLHILLSTTMLGAFGAPAMAQQAQPVPAAPPAGPAAQAVPEEEQVDISVPGGNSSEIVVIGRRIPNTVRLSREVV